MEGSVAKKLLKTDGEINWEKSPKELAYQIRAYYPWPGSYTFIDNLRLIIHKAHLEKDKLALDIVQKEGGKPIKWKEFLQGYHGKKPAWFSKIQI